MRSLFLLVVFVLCSIQSFAEKEIADGWSVSKDQTLIQAALSKALLRVNDGVVDRRLREKVSNIVCQTQVLNGMRIKLSFELDDHQWECLLYKSFVKVLEIRLEKCVSGKDAANEPVEEPKENNDELDLDDEAYIDEKANRNKDEPKDHLALDKDEDYVADDGEDDDEKAVLEEDDLPIERDDDTDDPVLEIPDDDDEQEDDYDIDEDDDEDDIPIESDDDAGDDDEQEENDDVQGDSESKEVQ